MEKQKNQPLEHHNRETPQRFFKLLEAGDLAFLDFMQYAIVVFGITKHGKTTYSHHLAGHSLQAYLNEDNTVHYRLSTQTDKRSDARIGAKMHSETQIPNKFQSGLFEGSTPVYLIDNPGQKDSFGINRVLSNAYFHYRIFTKIQNMKIILLFDYPTFSKKIKETNEILNLFLNCFTNFQKVKNKLLNSIAFVFTKVQRQVSMQDVIERIKGYLSGIENKYFFEPEKEQFVKKLFNLCIQSDNRIKLFRKAEIGVTVQINRNLIGEISSSLEYFSRDLIQNDEFQSKHYQQKKASMENIKFSESNRVLSLSNNQREKINTLNLFKQLTERGENLFKSLFEILTKLFNYILFNSETNQLSSNKKLNQTQIIRQKRRKALKQILQNLDHIHIEYDNTQKYAIKRQAILQRYAKCFKLTQKAENFIQRMVLATSFQNFCVKYTSGNLLLERNQKSLNNFRKDFEELIEKVSKLYSGKQEIEILSRFQYNFNTLLNQMIIFCMIILPNAEIQQTKDINSKIAHDDPYLAKFLVCFRSVPDYATKMNDSLVKELAKEFNLGRATATKLQQELIMDHYLRKFPRIIVDQGEHQESILRSLKNTEISLENKIHCEILIFNYLQKKFYFLTELNSFDQEDKQKIDLMASSPQDKKGRRQKKQQPPKEISKQNILCLIKSLIIYLKSVKKMKQLSQYNQFKPYKGQIFEINYLVWTYLVKLFCLLLETKDLSEIQKQEYKEILIEIVSTSKNYNLMEQVFEKLLEKHQEAFKQLTVKTSLRNLSKQTQKRIKLQSSDNLKNYLTSKKTLSQEIITLTLTYAQLLNDLGLKDKALTQCYSIMKYAQFSPSEVIKIEEMVQKIKSKNTGFRIEDNFRSVTEFEATMTIKKQLGRFLKDNSEIKQLQCVNFDFLN